MKLGHCSRGDIIRLCLLSGISRQAYYKYRHQKKQRSNKEVLLLDRVRTYRIGQPRIGGRKLYFLLKPFMQQQGINMGRDAFLRLLGHAGLLIKRKRGKPRTTDSSHHLRKYSDLVNNKMEPVDSNQLWVSDITHIMLSDKDAFLSLVTDAYSRKIVGYHLSDSLRTDGSIAALQMALSGCGFRSLKGLIHHSDRGSQYCSLSYTGLLKEQTISISMTQSGDPRDNAIAERVNGILKTELLAPVYDDLATATEAVKQAINTYNFLRPHSSISMLAPAFVHGRKINVKRHWKNYYRKSDINRADKVTNKNENFIKRKKEAKKEKRHQDVDNAARSPHPDTTNKQLIT